MDDKPYVRLVNSHTKRNGGYDDVNLFEKESVLIGCAGETVHAGVVWERLYVIDTKHLGQFLNFLAAEAIDNAAFACVVLDESYYITVNIGSLGSDFVI